LSTKAVLFDLYGTLADVVVDEQSDRFWSRIATAVGIGQGVKAGRQLREHFELLCAREHERGRAGSMLPAVFADLLRAAGSSPSERRIAEFAQTFRAESIVRLETRDYTTALLDLLRANGFVTAIVSNTEALLSRYDLGELGLREQVDLTALSSDLGLEKPDPEIFRQVMTRLGVSADQSVFVGDTEETDIDGALAAGMRALCIGPRPSRQHVAARVTYAEPTLEGLLDGLRALGVPLAE
jgi:putative hydrolase of the HAD superfamily